MNCMLEINMSLSFQKLTMECLHKIRPLLHSQLPASAQILNMVDLQLKGKSLKRILRSEFYGIPETTIISASNIMAESYYPLSSLVYIPPKSSFQVDLHQLANAYEKIVDWRKPHYFEFIPLPFMPYVEKLIQDKGGSVADTATIFLLYLPEEATKKLDMDIKRWEERAQGKFEMLPLSEEYAVKMNEYWKYGSEGVEKMLAEAVSTLGCARGVFRKGQINNEGLVSWGMVFPLGTVGCLYTLDEARGNGLAIWTYAACCKAVADELGIIPLCEVEHDNIASKSLMDKIGKKLVADVGWIKYDPPNYPTAVKQKTWFFPLTKLFKF